MLKDGQTPTSIMDFVDAVYTDKTSGGKRRTKNIENLNSLENDTFLKGANNNFKSYIYIYI
jgi:hypothetical protein